MITFRNLGKLGRFGNQLFQYASTRLYAETHGYSWAFPDWTGTSIFQNIRPYNTLEYFHSRLLPTVQLTDMQNISRLRRMQKIVHLWRQHDIHELYTNPNNNIDFYGYFQDPYSLRLLHQNKNKILSWLQWQPHIEQAFRDATSSYKNWVGLHIRRGDFVKRNFGMPIEQYQTVLDTLPIHTLAYISSDDPKVPQQLARPTIIYPRNPLVDVPNFIFDFWMLANASTVYGCGSTFSWWAAYLGNKNSYFSPLLTHMWPKGYVPTLEKQFI